MSVQGVTTGSSAFSASTGRLSLRGGEEFSQTLNLGQIIKGRVLRHYEGSRYLVDFGGHDKVVDSGVPLSTGEIVRGRVIAIGDRVELQRMYADDETASLPQADTGLQRGDRSEHWLDDLLARYQVELSADDRAVLNQVARSVSDPAALGVVGVALSKLGMLQNPELLQSVYALFKRMDTSTLMNSAQVSVEADNVATPMLGAPLVSVRQLADVLTKALGSVEHDTNTDSVDADSGNNSARADIQLAINPRLVKRVGDDEERQQQEQLAWAALNAQSEGVVGHRVGTLPLLIGDRLMEVSVALFEQRRDSDQQPQAQHRQLVFSLHTENLGAVQVSARVSGEHVRVRITTEDDTASQAFASFGGELRQTLIQSGWHVDEIAHESASMPSHNPAVASVIDHIALQDSLNQLI